MLWVKMALLLVDTGALKLFIIEFGTPPPWPWACRD